MLLHSVLWYAVHVFCVYMGACVWEKERFGRWRKGTEVYRRWNSLTHSVFLWKCVCLLVCVRAYLNALDSCAYVILCLHAFKSLCLCSCVYVCMCVCVCVQDPGRAAQPALCWRRQVNRASPSSARSSRHPRLCGLHHGVQRQRPPAGAQSGAGIAGHPWQVGITPPPFIISLFFPSVRLL